MRREGFHQPSVLSELACLGLVLLAILFVLAAGPRQEVAGPPRPVLRPGLESLLEAVDEAQRAQADAQSAQGEDL